MQNTGSDVEELLARGKTIQFKPIGYSMYPLFVPGRDQAVVAPLGDHALKRGDVALYRREGSILVLHRIWKCGRDGLYMVGDNQTQIEGPLKREQVRGILTGIIRDGRYFSARNPLYYTGAQIWLILRPVRPFLAKGISKCKKVFGRLQRGR